MNRIAPVHPALLCLGAIVSLFSNLTLQPLAAQAQAPEATYPSRHSALEFIQPSLSQRDLRGLSGRGAPQRRTAAGTRGGCPAIPASELGLTAVVPLHPATLEGENQSLAIGTTTAAYPTFWFYIPYAAEKIGSVRFVLLDQSENPVTAPLEVAIAGKVPGIVGFQLPQTEQPLEVDQYYRWYLKVDCHPIDATDVFVEALIQRNALSPALAQQLTTLSPREQVAFYAKNGFWYDTVTLLQSLRQSTSNPSSWQSDWTELLRSIGLEPLNP